MPKKLLTKRPDFRADPDLVRRRQRRKLYREYLGAGGWREASRKRGVSVLYLYNYVVHGRVPAPRLARVALGIEPGDLPDWVRIAGVWLGERDPGLKGGERVYKRGGKRCT